MGLHIYSETSLRNFVKYCLKLNIMNLAMELIPVRKGFPCIGKVLGSILGNI